MSYFKRENLFLREASNSSSEFLFLSFKSSTMRTCFTTDEPRALFELRMTASAAYFAYFVGDS
jgi:hypothetical protein